MLARPLPKPGKPYSGDPTTSELLTAQVLDVDVVCQLGEGPTWDAARQRAHFVDIDGGTLWELALGPDRTTATQVHSCLPPLGAAVHALSGGFLLATKRMLRQVDELGVTQAEFELVADSIDSRLNDGACDPAGRYLVGSLALDGRTGQERLWRLEQSGSVTVVDDDLTLSNGLGWSPDGGTFYNIDSVPGLVWVRDYDADNGRIGRRHRLLQITDATPDGMTVDGAGNLWIAIWSGAEVRAFTPKGELVEVVRISAPLITSCAFVGPELTTLLITSAGKEADGVEQTKDGGRVFTVEPGVRGRPTTSWKPVG